MAVGRRCDGVVPYLLGVVGSLGEVGASGRQVAERFFLNRRQLYKLRPPQP